MVTFSTRFTAKARGFALTEALVAIAIMGVALSALYQSVTGATRNARVSVEYAEALALAESTMNELSSQIAVGASEQGQFGAYSWTINAEPIDTIRQPKNDESDSDLALYTVVVHWAGGEQRREIALQSIAVDEVADES